MSPFLKHFFTRVYLFMSSGVDEWIARKAAHDTDPLFGDTPVEAELSGTMIATATMGGIQIARTSNAITTNAGTRVWFPCQHVDKRFLAPSMKRWR